MSKRSQSRTESLNIRIRPDLARAIRVAAAERDQSIAEYMEAMIERYLRLSRG